MHTESLTAKGILLNACVVIVASAVSAAGVMAQSQDPAVRQGALAIYESNERKRAFELYESNNFVAALPLLEKLVAAIPDDAACRESKPAVDSCAAILSRLGFVLYANSAAEKDPALRQKMRDRARATIMRSRSLGDTSNLSNMVFDALSAPDATQLPFSDIQAAEVAIREGEAAFVRGDMDKAIAAY